jgi:hypothetical protein
VGLWALIENLTKERDSGLERRYRTVLLAFQKNIVRELAHLENFFYFDSFRWLWDPQLWKTFKRSVNVPDAEMAL